MTVTLGEKALEVFLANDNWKEYYEQAPSDACRKAIEGEFVRSLNRLYGAEYSREALEAALGPEDWQWLYKWSGNNPQKGYIARKIRESGGELPAEDRQ